jgi:hypothetical protein
VNRQPRPEAVAAAAWWASKLGNATHIIGRPEDPSVAAGTAFANVATSMAGRAYTDAQRAAFRQALAERIEELIQRYTEQWPWEGMWDPTEPRKASAMRTVGCDYGPDPVLAAAAEQAGIRVTMLDLPMKTVMCIDPGEVKVSEGYGAEIQTVWKAD